MIIRCVFLLCLFLWYPLVTQAEWPLVQQGQPSTQILVSQTASSIEQWAVEELQHFIDRWTGVRLPVSDAPIAEFQLILGTPGNHPLVQQAQENQILKLPPSLGEEGYELRTYDHQIYVAALKPHGVLYGVYALLEILVEQITGLTPVDLDFVVPQVDTLILPELHRRDKPFYPIRSTLEKEDPDWLARHRVNMSGAEGVWNGTGIDDGLGSAFKYVDAPRFESFQDDPSVQRRARISQLRSRFERLQQRGIQPYLFMYVTGEPTHALVRNHPGFVGPPVSYGGSRDMKSYRPLCWSKPEVHALIRDLIQEIVRTYPNLSGLHLRSWGWETRSPTAPECGGDDAQDQLWQIYDTITRAAMEIRPDFRFYISGYNRSWLKDPEGKYLARLPSGTIISQKWGLDGEPTPDPGIDLEVLRKVTNAGAQLLILSHDTEEAMPLWMFEGDLFAQGLRQYAFQPSLHGLGGFTVQGQSGLSHLDKILSTRLPWDPKLNYESLLINYLSNHFGNDAAPHILRALRLNSWTLSSFFDDYASSLSVTGNYGHGSAGAATRFWQLIGEVPIRDTLSIPDLKTAEQAARRFAALLPQQQMATNEMEQARTLARPVTRSDETDLEDASALMHIWLNLFESRLKIVEAISLGYQGGEFSGIHQRIESAREYSRAMQAQVPRIHHFVRVFGYQDQYYRNSLFEEIQSEIELLENYDVNQLIHPVEETTESLELTEVLNYPNPLDSSGTTFLYRLNREADEVTLRIYTATGRRLWESEETPSERGRNEIFWDGRDSEGKLVANGAYLYRLRAVTGEEKITRIGKLAVLR